MIGAKSEGTQFDGSQKLSLTIYTRWTVFKFELASVVVGRESVSCTCTTPEHTYSCLHGLHRLGIGIFTKLNSSNWNNQAYIALAYCCKKYVMEVLLQWLQNGSYGGRCSQCAPDILYANEALLPL